MDREGLSVRLPFREELMVNPPDPRVSVGEEFPASVIIPELKLRL